jgi:hypothetical protein
LSCDRIRTVVGCTDAAAAATGTDGNWAPVARNWPTRDTETGPSRLNEQIVRALDGDRFEPLNSQAAAGLLAWADKASLVANPDRLTATLEQSPGPFGDGILELPGTSSRRGNLPPDRASPIWQKHPDASHRLTTPHRQWHATAASGPIATSTPRDARSCR